MDTKELEALLQGGSETQRIDFKAGMYWKSESLAKDILALSNVQDGGYIILGIEENPFKRAGITPQQKVTFNIENMRDQMTLFADPHVNFSVSFPLDITGIEYAVITVNEFEEVPVICRKDSTDTKAGVIYYRNRNRRIESAPVSNSYDMRDIVNRGAVKIMRGLVKVGLSVELSVKKKLDDELDGL